MTDKIDILAYENARKLGLETKYSSSAAEFAQYSDELGFVSPVEIWHKYKLPNNMTSAELSNLVRRLDFLYYYDAIHNADKEIEQAQATVHQELNNLIDTVKQLNPDLAFIDSYAHRFDFIYGVCYGFPPADIDYFLKSYDIVDKVWKKAKSLNIPPEQLEEFWRRENPDLNRQLNQYDLLEKHLGKCPNWKIAPKHLDALVKSITEQKFFYDK